MRKLILILAFLAFPVLGWATACDVPNSACYVRAGATGTADGSDWTNAYTVLPATLRRSYTYYLASGTYPEYYANTANSGTTTITIQAATTASHGTAVGWSSAYATDVSGPAIFNASTGGTGLSFNNNSSYWNVTGAGTYTGMGCGPGGAGCGLKIDGSACTSAYCYNLGLCLAAYHGWTSCPHDISVSYLEILGAGFANADTHVDSNVHMDSDGWTSSNGGGSNFTLSHLYLHGSSGGPFFTEFVTGITLDHSYITGNVSTSTHHGEAWADMGSSNVTISNDNFEDAEGSGFIVELDRGGCTASCIANNWLMYGDIFYYDNGNTRSCTTAPCNTGIGDGVIDCINGMICTGWVIEQDTFANLYGINAALCEDCTAEGNVASTWTVRNNLWYGNTNGGIEMGSEEHKCAACTVTEDYNSILGYNTGTLDTGFFSGAHDVILVATPSSPFVSWTANPPNFHLVGDNADWNGGVTLTSPYNIDPDGVVRGISGSWDRGVFQLTGAPAGCGPGTDQSLCGNVGDPYAGGGAPTPDATIAACGALTPASPGYVYRVTANIGSDATANCITWSYTNSFVLDLYGHTVTGMIHGTNSPYGLTIMNGTVNCNSVATGCVDVGQDATAAAYDKIHHLTINQAALGGRIINFNQNNLYSPVATRYIQVYNVQGTLPNASEDGNRAYFVWVNGGNTVPAEVWNSTVSPGANLNAFQGIAMYATPGSLVQNNYIILPHPTYDTGVYDPPRAILFDCEGKVGSPCGGNEAAYNQIVADVSRAIRVRAETGDLIHDNLLQDCRFAAISGGCINIGDTDIQGEASSAEVYANTIELNDGNGINLGGDSHSTANVHGNTVTCYLGSCSSALWFAMTQITESSFTHPIAGPTLTVNNTDFPAGWGSRNAVLSCGPAGNPSYVCGVADDTASVISCNTGVVVGNGNKTSDCFAPINLRAVPH